MDLICNLLLINTGIIQPSQKTSKPADVLLNCFPGEPRKCRNEGCDSVKFDKADIGNGTLLKIVQKYMCGISNSRV